MTTTIKELAYKLQLRPWSDPPQICMQVLCETLTADKYVSNVETLQRRATFCSQQTQEHLQYWRDIYYLWLYINIIYLTLTIWTTGSLNNVRTWSLLCVRIHTGVGQLVSTTFLSNLTHKNSQVFLVLLMGFKPRVIGSSPTLYQLSHHPTTPFNFPSSELTFACHLKQQVLLSNFFSDVLFDWISMRYIFLISPPPPPPPPAPPTWPNQIRVLPHIVAFQVSYLIILLAKEGGLKLNKQ